MTAGRSVNLKGFWPRGWKDGIAITQVGKRRKDVLGHVRLRYLLDVPEEMLNMQSDKQAWLPGWGPLHSDVNS